MLAYRAALGAIHGLAAFFYPLFALFLSALGADVSAWFERADELVCFDIRLAAELTSAAYDKRSARLVYKYTVHLVYDSERERTLNAVFCVSDHIVAQIVETELAVGRIHNVAVVSVALFVSLHAAHIAAYRESEETENFAHPVAVVFSEIFVDGNDVHAFAGESVEVSGQRSDKRLAFARLHLCDPALMQNYTADDLDVKVFHAEHAPARLSYRSESLGKKVVELFSRSVPVFILLSACGEFFVAHCLKFRLERHYLVCCFLEFFEFPRVSRREQS